MEPQPQDPRPPLALGLRAKLALGFAALLAIQLAFGVENVSLLDRLGGSIDVILRENYKSVVACERMKEALERMDSGALFALSGEPAEGRKLVAENHPRFEAALKTELGNITLPGEGERAERLRQLYAAYAPVLGRVQAAELPLEARRALYFRELYPTFRQIKQTADEVLEMNQGNMVQANDRARALAAAATRRIVLLLLAAVALAGICVALLSHSILGPLETLTRAAAEIARGRLDLAIPVTSRDELGRLGGAFNSMAAGLRELRESDQAQLLRARRVAQAALDALPEAVAVVAATGKVELANRAATALLGIDPGQPLPERHDGWLLPLLARAASGHGPRRESEAPLRLGPEAGSSAGAGDRLLLPRAVGLGATEGGAGTILVAEDVTERMRDGEARATLLAGAARDLERALAPLRPVAEGAGAGASAASPGAQEIRSAARRLSEVAANLLAMSRREGAGQELPLRPVAARELVDEALREAAAAYREEQVELLSEVRAETPRVLVDRPRAALVLKALLRNALVHSPEKGKVMVGAESWEGRVRFAVTDSGPGVAEASRERIFEPLFQVPGTEDQGVAGLGLTVARDIVRAHGGEIHCEGEEGKGATFWFTFPAAGS